MRPKHQLSPCRNNVTKPNKNRRSACWQWRGVHAIIVIKIIIIRHNTIFLSVSHVQERRVFRRNRALTRACESSGGRTTILFMIRSLRVWPKRCRTTRRKNNIKHTNEIHSRRTGTGRRRGEESRKSIVKRVGYECTEINLRRGDDCLLVLTFRSVWHRTFTCTYTFINKYPRRANTRVLAYMFFFNSHSHGTHLYSRRHKISHPVPRVVVLKNTHAIPNGVDTAFLGSIAIRRIDRRSVRS